MSEDEAVWREMSDAKKDNIYHCARILAEELDCPQDAIADALAVLVEADSPYKPVLDCVLRAIRGGAGAPPAN